MATSAWFLFAHFLVQGGGEGQKIRSVNIPTDCINTKYVHKKYYIRLPYTNNDLQSLQKCYIAMLFVGSLQFNFSSIWPLFNLFHTWVNFLKEAIIFIIENI